MLTLYGTPCSPSVLTSVVLRAHCDFEALLAAGADVLLLNKDGKTPAAFAVASNRKANAALISSFASKPFLTGV